MNTTAFLSSLAALFLSSTAFAAGGNTGVLTLECPGTGKVYCGSPITPDFTGEAIATSTCPGPVVVTYSDSAAIGANCPTRRFNAVIVRTWTATDNCGNTASCVQNIDVVRQVWSLDIKPTSCPNPIQVGSNGGNAAVMVGLLGTAAHDVFNVDPASIAIWREDCVSGPVYPIDFGYEDVAAPWAPDLRCGCTTAGPDGFLDLRLKFSRQQLVQGLGLGSLQQGSYHRLVITGRTLDGCELVASDCVRIQ